MADTGIQTSANRPIAPPLGEIAREPKVVRKRSMFWRIVQPIASLRLTVVLFGLAIFLVFAGTVAQIDSGVWTVVAKYFRSAYVWIPFQIFFPRTVKVPGGFPYPGGWLIGGVMLVNLIAAHAQWFSAIVADLIKAIRQALKPAHLGGPPIADLFLSVLWRLLERSGIVLIHLGLIVMMVSEIITGVMAEERFMRIEAGKSANYIEDGHRVELAIVDPSGTDADHVVAIPSARLRQGGVITNDDLPFDVQLVKYMVNSKEPTYAEGKDNPADSGIGRRQWIEEKPEGSGVSQDQREDMPSAYVTFLKKGTSEPLGTYLVSMWYGRPQHLTAGDKTYEVSLRRKRSYTPYTIQLKSFTHSSYPNTNIPKDYASEVHLVDPTRHEEREVRISMNAPLRYEGETFYQSGVNQTNRGKEIGTILQVVRNPGWTLPYISCLVVSLGLFIHFGIHLVGFLIKRAAA
jgi:hypothetical protein